MQIADPRSTPWEVKGQQPKPSPCQGQDGVLSLWSWEGPANTHVRAGRGLKSLLVRALLLQGTLRPRQARVRDRCTSFATSAPSQRNSTGLTTCGPAHECSPILRTPSCAAAFSLSRLSQQRGFSPGPASSGSGRWAKQAGKEIRARGCSPQSLSTECVGRLEGSCRTRGSHKVAGSTCSSLGNRGQFFGLELEFLVRGRGG